MYRLLYLVLLVSSSLIYANDTSTTIKPPADILLPDDMKGQIVTRPPAAEQSEFIKTAMAYQQQLRTLEYSARRHAWRFGYNEVETMKGINHLINLIGTTIQYGEKSPEGSEAFYMMKQPLQYASQFLPYNPLFSHVVHHWDSSLQSYQRLVQLFTGTNVQPSPPVDFNSPLFKQLQMQARELKDLAEQFSYQLKKGLPITNTEHQALIAMADHFSIYCGKMHANTYSFVTQKFELEQNLISAIKISKQITANILYNRNEYIKNSWTVIRGKANQFKSTFEQIMR